MKLCECGCKNKIESKYGESYILKRRFIKGHNKSRKGIFKDNPNKRAYHERARNSINCIQCSIKNKDCGGKIEVAHIDQNYKNNNLNNLKPLCASHHRLLDKNFKKGLRFNDLKNLKVEFTISSNKRRYKKIIW